MAEPLSVPPHPAPRSRRFYVLAATILALTYAALSVLAISFASLPGGASPVYPSPGLGVAVVLRLGWGLLPGVTLGQFLLSLYLYDWQPLGAAIGAFLAFGSTLEVAVTSGLARRFGGGDRLFDRLGSAGRFAVLAVPAGSILGAINGTTATVVGNGLSWDQWPTIWNSWWVGDAVGIWVAAPLVLAWWRPSSSRDTTRVSSGDAARAPERSDLRGWRWLELAGLVGAAIAIGRLAFWGGRAVEYLLVPLLLWAAFRFGPKVVTALLAGLSAIAILGTAAGRGPFVQAADSEAAGGQSLVLLQSFIGALAIVALLACAAIAETRHSQRALRQANDALEQRVAERTADLARTEAELRGILAAMTDLVAVFDRDGRYQKIFVDRATPLYREASKRLGKTLADCFPPETARRLQGVVTEVLAGGNTGEAEYAVEVEGETHWFAAQASRASENRVVWVARDVTRQKATEAALRRAEQQYRAIFENAVEGIFVSTREGRYLSVNPALARIYDYDSPEALKAALTDIGTQLYADPNRRREFLAIMETQGATTGFVSQVRRRDGSTTWISENARAAIDPETGATYYEGTVEDISERLAAEAALLRAKEAAEAANQAKSAFIANMSHELRSPLNAILGFAQVMHRSDTLPPDHRENAAIVLRSGEHLLSLIDQVLNFSKIEAGRVGLHETHFDFHRFLDDLETLFDLRAREKQLQFEIARGPGLPAYLYADELKLRQVAINLLNNALKFTESGGVFLRVWPLPEGSVPGDPVWSESDAEGERLSSENALQTPSVSAGDAPDPGSTDAASGPATDPASGPAPGPIAGPVLLHFQVEDTGRGIAPAERDRLFQAFSQTQSGLDSQEGTGLGLVISQKFVQLLGGELTVRSELGWGTCFSFEIPVHPSSADRVRDREQPRRVLGLAPGQPGYRILVVDDKETNRRLLVKLLAPLGFEVREAADGQAAIALWDEWEPHLVWMDMRMPVMDGYRATQAIKATDKGQATVVIALTASAFEEQRASILATGCDDFMRKPFREADLLAMMEKHLGVEFTYADRPAAGDDAPASDATEALASAAFANLPLADLQALHQAIASVDPEAAEAIAVALGDRDPALAAALRNALDRFEYDRVLAAIAPLLAEETAGDRD